MIESIINTLSVAGSMFVQQIGQLEIYTAGLLGLMVAVLIVGALQNSKISKKAFLEGAKIALDTQFASPATSLYKESHNHYFAYSTGRQGCSGMMTSIHLSPRQDFISRFVLSWFWPSMYQRDRIVLEVQGAEIDAAVTGLICKKYQSQKILEKFSDLKKFGKPSNSSLDNSCFAKYSCSPLSGYTYICDIGGKAIGGQVFASPKIEASKTLLDSLKYVYLSGEKKVLEVELDRLPADESEWAALVDFVLAGLLDSISTIKVSENIRAQVLSERTAEANREREAADRQEAAEKKAAMKKKEREEMLKRMNPQEAAKFEGKERKRELKKKMASGRMFM
jgi:hypothetical protein